MVEVENGKSTNDIIVTVYEEASAARLPRPKNDKIRAPDPTKPQRSGGYDRRAELLARVHQLRNASSQQIHQEPSPIFTTPKHKRRKRFLGSLGKFRLQFGRIFGKSKSEWRYETIETEGCERRYRLCRPRKTSWRTISKRFSNVLRHFSSGWTCNKGFNKREDEEFDVHRT